MTPTATVPKLSPDANATDANGRRIWHAGTLVYTSSSLATLFVWLLWGDFAWMIKEHVLWPLVPLILKGFKASDTVIAFFVGTLPAAIGLLLGPVISYRSDRTRSRRGWRIPYLLVTTPFAAVALIGCAFSATLGQWLHGFLGAHSPGRTLLSVLRFGIAWTIFEVGTVAANAVFYALINDVAPHPLLGRFFRIISRSQSSGRHPL
jgi:maltose/moltooligosaccharide transporter